MNQKDLQNYYNRDYRAYAFDEDHSNAITGDLKNEPLSSFNLFYNLFPKYGPLKASVDYEYLEGNGTRKVEIYLNK